MTKSEQNSPRTVLGSYIDSNIIASVSVIHQTPAGASHRSFGFRTQSNSIGLIRSIEFDGARPSPKKTSNQTKSNVRLISVIERSGTHKRKTRIEQNRAFDFLTLDGKYVD